MSASCSKQSRNTGSEVKKCTFLRWREALRGSESSYLEMFIQELRRFYPFFPFVAARVRSTFAWHGYEFPQGTRALLDLYGTNHDAAIWKDPHTFQPERFSQRENNGFDFIPQGGGEHYMHHRCAGEWATIALMKRMTKCLIHSMEYRVPEQALGIGLTRIPALPESRFIIST